MCSPLHGLVIFGFGHTPAEILPISLIFQKLTQDNSNEGTLNSINLSVLSISDKWPMATS